MAASHGLIARGDLSGNDFVCQRHEFAIRWLAASHGLVAAATFPVVTSCVEDTSSPAFGMAASHGFEP